ncbi:YlzJ-like family protein [Cohnella zeiphila]|uniref:YlzJ-like family protein n=1 Tax=Cohnella zeiphila TaxID=2761120 RepID=A0A7X0VYZ0_9BACL|nr:YlzJ-like family protein [Cohnella zeiphila]MBB6735486.1 YlzJ-like family protein [Cohnella zeiphila]
MTLYTCMPLELVLDGMHEGPGPLVEVGREGLTMLVAPTAPGVGRIVRLLVAPLEYYLKPEYAPGSIVLYGGAGLEEKTAPPQLEPPLM